MGEVLPPWPPVTGDPCRCRGSPVLNGGTPFVVTVASPPVCSDVIGPPLLPHRPHQLQVSALVVSLRWRHQRCQEQPVFRNDVIVRGGRVARSLEVVAQWRHSIFMKFFVLKFLRNSKKVRIFLILMLIIVSYYLLFFNELF